MQFEGGALPMVTAPALVPHAAVAARPSLIGPIVTPRALTSPTILVFDSGLGGLTVYREVAQARPDARFVYVADDAFFPYGARRKPARRPRDRRSWTG